MTPAEAQIFDPLLLAATRVLTFEWQRQLTNASGIFFARDERLFVVTSCLVLGHSSREYQYTSLMDRLHSVLGLDDGFSAPDFSGLDHSAETAGLG